MSISATNEINQSIIEHSDLLKYNPLFFEILSELSGGEKLNGIEIIKENRIGVFTAKFKTHGFGIVITSDSAKNDGGYFYSIAKPLFSDNLKDDTIELAEGPLNYDTVYTFKKSMLQLMIIK